MKHIESGLKAGLGMGTLGETFINIEVLNENLGKSKTIRFLIDTGFNGYLQLSESDVLDLGLIIHNKSESSLADGRKVEIGITSTKIKILDEEITNFPIQVIANGVSLIGTRLLKDTKKMIVFDYDGGYATITSNTDLKKQIKVLIDSINSL
jgi:clan AA aspartic protease